MNDDGTPIEGAPAESTGSIEGGRATATANEVAELYDELGIDAPVPTGATKGRPKSTDVRAKNDKKKDSGSSDNDGGAKGGRKAEDSDDKGKSKDAPASDKNGDSGNSADSKTPKNGEKDGKVQDESEEAGKGVRKAESESEDDSERRSEEDADRSDKRPGQKAHESDDSEEEGEDDGQGKRPGKSNPAVEKRFQQLAAERKEALERAERAEQQLKEATQKQRETQIQQEDPEYTVADFKKVRDEQGDVYELDDDQAELQYRRWKDGYEARKEQRNAEQNRLDAIEEYRREAEQAVFQSSVEAYDTLTDILETYPELKKGSPDFDEDFSNRVTPLIEKMIIYQEGTEPGNENGVQSVIIGLKVDPRDILEVISEIKASKRNLPLNGLNDTVDTRSDVSVPHSRSSDSTVNQANELYKSLGINKRIK